MKTTFQASEKLAKELELFTTQKQEGLNIRINPTKEITNPFTKLVGKTISYTISGDFTPADLMAIGRIQERING